MKVESVCLQRSEDAKRESGNKKTDYGEKETKHKIQE